MDISQADCQAIFQALDDAILVYDRTTGAILDANRGMCEMFGYSLEEIREFNVAALGAGESGGPAECLQNRPAGEAPGSTQVYEWRARDRAGRVFWVEAHLKPIRLDGREPILAVLRNIDRRKQTEEALQESEARYRMVTESSLAGVYLIQDGLFRYVNPMLAQAFGYTPGELIDRLGPLDLVHPEDQARITGTMRLRLAGEGIEALNHFKGLRKDGAIIYCEVFSRRVEYLGQPAIMGTLLDVTERRRAEEALKASEDKYRTIFNAVNDAILVIDPETSHFLEVNRKFLELTGYTGETGQLSLENVCRANLPFTPQDAQELIRKAVEEGPQLFEWCTRGPVVREVWVELNLSLTPLGGRNLLLAVGRDISERKQLEVIRRRAFEDLEHLVTRRTDDLRGANDQLRREIDVRQRAETIIRRQRDLALALSGKMGLHETLRLCVETAITFSGLDSGGVYLVNPGSGALELAYHQGLSPEFVQQVAHIPPDSILAHTVMARSPLYARLEDLPGLLDEESLKEGLRAAAIIPVIHQDRVIASINLASHTREEVPVTARAALETLAAQVGSAIARVQAEEALRRAKEDLEIKVAERTAQCEQINAVLEEELRGRVTIEKSLRESELKYRALVEQMPGIVYFASLRAGFESNYISPQIRPMLGFSPEEWEPEGIEIWKRQLHPEDRERMVAEVNRSMALGKPFVTEYRLLTKSGRVLWFRDEAKLIYDEDGLPLFMQGLAQDITERKQTDEALRETTHTLRTLIQASPLAIIVVDQDLHVRLWNPGAERIFGWTESEVLGRHLPYIPADQRAGAIARIKRTLAGEMHAGLDLRRQKKDGSPIDVQLWTAPLKDAHGKVTGIMGMFADITERKQVEKALIASEANYRTIFNGVNDGIGVVDIATGNFLDVNRKWQEMSGFTAAEARRLNITALCADLPDYTVGDAFQFVKAATQEGPQIFEWLGTTKDGRTHWVELNLKRAVINDQERLLTVVRDISARKRAEAELRRQAELLDLAHDAILVRDLNNRILFWNSGAEETYGWTKSEAQGRNAHELLETGFPIPMKELKAEFLRQGQWQGELAHTRRDGRRIMVTSRWVLQQGKEGKPAAILEINRDITEQKQAEAGRARLAAILEATSDLVGTADRKGRVLYLNRAGRNLLGIGEEEDVSRFTVRDLQPDWVYRLILKEAGAATKSRQVWSAETAFLTRRGLEIPTSQVVVAHHDSQGRVEFFSTIARDISARKQAEIGLKQSEQELRLLTNRILNLQEQEHRRVARELHDELGQALTVLKINLAGIEEKLAPDQENLRAGCEQMMSYIDVVIENVRRLSWDLSPSSLDDLGLSASLRYLVEDICHNHQMQSRVTLDEIDSLFSPEIQINIYRIFQESLTNIVKHAKASRVSVQVKKQGGQVSFLIKDNGCGFDLKRAISRKATQKNLGLTAMHERALMGGGSLQITSRKGQGTTIRFALPIQRKLP